ncbi:MAG: hypothetical protein JWQ69_4820 [Pseudomonas sp.]|nr:hypothetical protein [Pseudomonas sp.]
MTHDKFKSITGMTWEEASTRSNQLFFEADRLDEMAYSLLKCETLDTQVWGEFSAAKSEAGQKYVEARQEWQRIKQILSSLEPHAGKKTARHAQH